MFGCNLALIQTPDLKYCTLACHVRDRRLDYQGAARADGDTGHIDSDRIHPNAWKQLQIQDISCCVQVHDQGWLVGRLRLCVVMYADLAYVEGAEQAQAAAVLLSARQLANPTCIELRSSARVGYACWSHYASDHLCK